MNTSEFSFNIEVYETIEDLWVSHYTRLHWFVLGAIVQALQLR